MRLAICFLAIGLCSGCFAFDEIDKGRAEMETYSPSQKAPESPATAGGEAGESTGVRQRLAEYYAKQRAKAAAPRASDDPYDAIGQCRIDGSVSFLRRSDCELRRGTFL